MMAGLLAIVVSSVVCVVEGRADMSRTMIEGRSVDATLTALAAGQVTATGLVAADTARVAVIDAAGLRLQAGLAMDAAASDAVAALYAAHAAGSRRWLRRGENQHCRQPGDAAGRAGRQDATGYQQIGVIKPRARVNKRYTGG